MAKTPAVELKAANQVWCMDFCHDRLENGRPSRILAVRDCFTWEFLLLKAAPSLPSFAVEKELEWLFLVHGKPERFVTDTGHEFRALELPTGVVAGFIQPGKPWQKGRVESFFDKLRDEVLQTQLLSSGEELNSALTEFHDHYNHHRPHRSVGMKTPLGFKEGLTTNNQQTATLTLKAGNRMGARQNVTTEPWKKEIC